MSDCPFCRNHPDGMCFAHKAEAEGRKVRIEHVAADPEKSRREIFEAHEATRKSYVPALRNRRGGAE